MTQQVDTEEEVFSHRESLMYPAYNYKAPKCFTGMLDAVLAVTAPFERRGTDGRTNQEILNDVKTGKVQSRPHPTPDMGAPGAPEE